MGLIGICGTRPKTIQESRNSLLGSLKQLDLSDAPESNHSDKLYATIDNISQRYGKRTVFHLGEDIK